MGGDRAVPECRPALLLYRITGLHPEREVFRPLRGTLEPQAEKLWADSKPLRDQIAGLFKSATPGGRERLVRSFQSWIGHFHAT